MLISKIFSSFQVKDTGRYGKGVFACEDIEKGQTIIIFGGEIISFEECYERIENKEENITDSLMVGPDKDLDLDEVSRTFNHSCKPNAALKGLCELFAIKDIKKDEEITYDYSATEGPNIPDSLWSMKCDCGSNECRKVLGNVLTIPKDKLQEYIQAGGLQDYIREMLGLLENRNGIVLNSNQFVFHSER